MTTIPATSVPSALAYLIPVIQAQIDADPNAGQILLSMAKAGSATDAVSEIVSVGKVVRTVDINSFVGSGGQNFLEEKYDIACGVSVWTGSTDTDGATTIQLEQVQRAWQLYSYVETAIRLDPSLGVLVQRCYPRSATQDEPEWTDDPIGLLVEINFQIHVDNVS